MELGLPSESIHKLRCEKVGMQALDTDYSAIMGNSGISTLDSSSIVTRFSDALQQPLGQGWNGDVEEIHSSLSATHPELTAFNIMNSELKELRESLLTDRLRLREMRDEIADSAKIASDHRAKIVDEIRDLFEKNDVLDGADIRTIYRNVLAAQDEYGALETDYFEAQRIYNEKEESFNSREWIAFNKDFAHNKFVSLYTEPAVRGPDSIGESLSAENLQSNPIHDPAASNCQVEVQLDEYSPLPNEHLHLIGKIDMLQERLSGLLLEQAEYQEILNLELPSGKMPDPEDVDEVNKLIVETEEELSQATSDYQKLQKVFHDDSYIIENQHGSRYAGRDFQDATGGKTVTMDHLTANQEIEDDGEAESFISHCSSRYTAIFTRINAWIIDMLKESRVEIARLRNLVDNSIPEDEDWQNAVHLFCTGDPDFLECNGRPGGTEISSSRHDALQSQPCETKNPENSQNGSRDFEPYYDKSLDIDRKAEVTLLPLSEKGLQVVPSSRDTLYVGCWMQ